MMTIKARMLKNGAPIELFRFVFLLLAVHFRVSGALYVDKAALLAFKARVDDPRGVFSNWNDSDTTPCNWNGIVCSNVTHFVTFIDLPFLNLSGTIAPQLGGLKYLERLSLDHNDFMGKIPKSLSNLTNLRILNLRHNSLSGDIPLALGTLIDLQVLDLAENKLEGPIPESFSNLTSLSYFNLSNNQLIGRVPQGALLNFNLSSYSGNANLCVDDGVGLPACSLSPVLSPSVSPGMFLSWMFAFHTYFSSTFNFNTISRLGF